MSGAVGRIIPTIRLFHFAVVWSVKDPNFFCHACLLALSVLRGWNGICMVHETFTKDDFCGILGKNGSRGPHAMLFFGRK
jgi:hypothetical protein